MTDQIPEGWTTIEDSLDDTFGRFIEIMTRMGCLMCKRKDVKIYRFDTSPYVASEPLMLQSTSLIMCADCFVDNMENATLVYDPSAPDSPHSPR